MRGVGSAREFEIKLEIPAQAAGKVMRLPWLWELASGELSASRMQAVYYDTPDYALREHGVSVRVRRTGATRIQTIKASLGGAALPIEREEWEEEITTDEPDLKLADAPFSGLRRKKLQRQLAPCFEIHVDRSAFPIQSANSSIEVAIDRAQIVGDDAASFCELELELKRGASSEMARVARRIASEVPAALSLKTKAERGYALRQRLPPRAFFGDRVRLDAATRVGEAFQGIGWICLRHFALNKDAVEAGDATAVHEMRKGLERLRAAIAIFHRLLDGPETDAVAAELHWLGAELAPACELDVFLESTLQPVQCDDAEAASLNTLCEEVSRRRQLALERAKQATISDRYRQLELRVALWLIAAEWSDKAALASAEPSRRISPFAAEALSRATRRALKALSRPSQGEPTKPLAETLLTLNHAHDFFADLYPAAGRSRKALRRVMQNLLDDSARLTALGMLEQLRDEFMMSWSDAETGADPRASAKAFALGLSIGQLAPDKAARRDGIEQATRRLARLPDFWRRKTPA